MTKAYRIGREYRSWLASQQDPSNAAIRSALQDFAAGSNISISLVCDIATHKELRAFSLSQNRALPSSKCDQIIKEISKIYNIDKVVEAKRFLEGVAGFAEGSFHEANEKADETGVSTSAIAKKGRITGCRSLYLEGARLAIRSLGQVETYTYYAAFLGIIDFASAWQTTKDPENPGFGLLGLSSNLWILYATALVIIFHHLYGSGKSLQELGAKEFWRRVWASYKASFIAGLYIIGGLILFVVPGLILIVRYMFVSQIAVLENRDIDECLRHSRELARRVRWSVINASILSFVTYVVLVLLMEALIGEAATKTFGYNWILAGLGSVWGIWLSGIIYSGYVKASSALSNN